MDPSSSSSPVRSTLPCSGQTFDLYATDVCSRYIIVRWYSELCATDEAVEGMDIVKTIEPKGSQSGATSSKATIAKSGTILSAVLRAHAEKKITDWNERKESVKV